MSAPRVIIEVAAPGASQAAAGLRDVASAQASIGTAQDGAAKAAAGLASKFNLNAEAIEKARGATAPFTAAVVGLKGAMAGGMAGVTSFTAALGGIPGPLGLVGQAATLAITAYQTLTASTDTATAAVKAQTSAYSFLAEQLGFVRVAMAEAILETDRNTAAEQALTAAVGVRLALIDPATRAQVNANAEAIRINEGAIKASREIIAQQEAELVSRGKLMEAQKEEARAAAKGGNVQAIQAAAARLAATQAESIALAETIQRNKDQIGTMQAGIRTAEAWTKGLVSVTKATEGIGVTATAAAPAVAKLATAMRAAASAGDTGIGEASRESARVGLSLIQARVEREIAADAEVAALGAESLAREEALEQARFALVASGVEDRLARRRDEAAESQRLAEETARAQVEAQTKLTEAMVGSGAAYAKAALSAVLYGGSVKEAINATARAAFIEGTVGALGALAKAAVFSVINPPAVAPMLSAAAIFGAQAAIAGGIAAATGGLTGGGGKQQAADLSAPQDFGRDEPTEAQDTTMTVNLFGEGTQRRPLDRSSAAAIIGALADLVGSGGRMELRRA